MQNNSGPYRFLFSAGGTGGHIFPAISVADALKEKYPNSEFLFIGAKDRMEMEKVPAAGYEIVGLNISGIARKASFKLLIWPFKLIGSLMQAMKVIRKFKPNMALGFGGFASGPAIYMASLLGVKSIIQEQNSYAGITNRILSGKVEKICVAYDNMDQFFPSGKVVKTGNPVRKDIAFFKDNHEEGLSHFELDASFPVLFVFGGSQGALAINEAIYANLDDLLSANFQIVWQCGRTFFPIARKLIEERKLSNRIKAFEFILDMEKAYQAADIIVARAGAISISELCLVGKPVVFVPLPSAAEDHQSKNAMALVEKDAALMVKNSEAKEELGQSILKIKNDSELTIRLSQNIKELGINNATDLILKEVDKILAV
ncbi:MAG: undecaprenyldiphospho-muramoylpentapeptide beta-N-acetylglucosaminyltransferase [Cytophagales bacterium]